MDMVEKEFDWFWNEEKKTENNKNKKKKKRKIIHNSIVISIGWISKIRSNEEFNGLIVAKENVANRNLSD